MTREVIFTTQEINAMNEKIDHPEKEVICPRCGGLLEFTEWPTAVEVQCETENCLHGSIRGIYLQDPKNSRPSGAASSFAAQEKRKMREK